MGKFSFNYSNVTWTAPEVSEDTTYIITVTRGDKRGYIGTGQFEITVKNDGDVPVGDVVVNPTIHSVPEGGDWNNEETWMEGRVPTENDEVEINGYVKVNQGASISGLLISETG